MKKSFGELRCIPYFSMKLLIYIIVFLYGVVIGSFLNVCILRIPNGETIVSERSHCMKCGYQLAWFDLIPLFSYIFCVADAKNAVRRYLFSIL